MGNIEAEEKEYSQILNILQLFPKFNINQDKYDRQQFLQMSRKYHHNYQFLNDTVKIFCQFKKEYNNNYNHFIDQIQINEQNYK